MSLAEKIAIASLILNSGGVMLASVKIAISIGELKGSISRLIEQQKNTDETMEDHNTRISRMEGRWDSRKT